MGPKPKCASVVHVQDRKSGELLDFEIAVGSVLAAGVRGWGAGWVVVSSGGRWRW